VASAFTVAELTVAAAAGAPVTRLALANQPVSMSPCLLDQRLPDNGSSARAHGD